MTVGLGQVQVVVPRDVSIVVVARSGAGQASLFDQIYDGLKVDVTRTYEPPGASGQLQLDIEAGLGQVVGGRPGKRCQTSTGRVVDPGS